MFHKTPTGELSDQTVKRGLWIAQHKAQLQRAGLMGLILVTSGCVLVLLFSIWNWFSHIQSTAAGLAQLSRPTVNADSRPQPAALTVGKTEVVRYDDRSVDVIAELINPNQYWAATSVPYTLVVGGQSATIDQTVSLAPNQTWFVVANHVPWTQTDLPTLEVRLGDVVWQRLIDTSNLPIPDWVPSDTQYGPVFSTPETAVYRTQLGFTLINKTQYTFRDPQVIVVIRDASGQLMGLGNIVLDTVTSQQQSPLHFYWPNTLPRDATAQVIVNTPLLTP